MKKIATFFVVFFGVSYFFVDNAFAAKIRVSSLFDGSVVYIMVVSSGVVRKFEMDPKGQINSLKIESKFGSAEIDFVKEKAQTISSFVQTTNRPYLYIFRRDDKNLEELFKFLDIRVRTFKHRYYLEKLAQKESARARTKYLKKQRRMKGKLKRTRQRNRPNLRRLFDRTLR